MTPRELLVETYRAFNRRDIEAVLAVMAPTVEPLRFEPDDAGRIVVDVHQVVRDLAGNVKADQTVQHVYELHDGLITRMEIRKP